MRLNLQNGNTEKEWCKTGKKQTVEDRVMSFEWVCVPKTSSECDAALESPKLAG
jgi:hypothetical protein